MEIQKIFSDMYDDERLYSVLLSEEEMYLFSVMKDELEGAGAAAAGAGLLAGAGYGITKGAGALRRNLKEGRVQEYKKNLLSAADQARAEIGEFDVKAAKKSLKDNTVREARKKVRAELKKKNKKLSDEEIEKLLSKEKIKPVKMSKQEINSKLKAMEQLHKNKVDSNVKRATEKIKMRDASKLEKLALSTSRLGHKVTRHIGNNKLAYGLGAGTLALGAGAVNASRKNN